MIQRISIEPKKVTDYGEFTLSGIAGMEGFPILAIDTDSYIVGAEIQSGINFDVAAGRHCLALGKGCSLAEGITFMIDLNHEYRSVAQGELSFLKDCKRRSRIRRKGSVIIQNDVWVGHGATIMSGVILHNGCVVASDAVVTKDVPPYAIVGGNPARVIRYRFDGETVKGLQKIAWWNWPEELKWERREDFSLPAEDFVEKYLPESEERLSRYSIPAHEDGRKIVLLYPDVQSGFPLYPKILRQFLKQDREDLELIVYLSKQQSTKENISRIEAELGGTAANGRHVTLQTGGDIEPHLLFQYANCYVTTRDRHTVYHTELCDLYGVKVLFGTDDPIFVDA